MTRRRSKIRSKTRSDSSQKSEDEILYCICRSSDGTRFMIACDNCEEWYHGDCINVTSKQANNIKRFFCHLCIGRNPSLEIEYKTSKENRPRLPNLRQQIKKINFSSDEENDADLSSSSSPDKSLASTKSKRATRKRWRPSISESVGKKRRGRPKERQDDYDDEATEDEIETSGFAHSMNECVDDGADSAYIEQGFRTMPNSGRVITRRGPIGRSQIQNKSSQRSFISNNYLQDITKSCGVCEPCKRNTDCGQCDNCRKYGPSAHPRNICRKRCCIHMEFRNQSRKSYQVAKDYGTLIDDELDGVLEDPEYHPQHMRRRGGDFPMNDARQRPTNTPVTNKDTCAIGSKMRRGDHLPGGGHSSSHRRSLTNASVPYKSQADDDSLELVNGTSYRYHQPGPNNRLSKNQPSQPHGRRVRNQSTAAAQMSSNTSSVSGGQISSQHYQYADESDEDVMIPAELISPTNGQRIEDSDVSRHFSSYQQQRSTKTAIINEIKHHYGLSYPDHLYCKHHRSYDWHGTITGSDDLSSEMVVLPVSNMRSVDSSSSSSIMKQDKEIDLVHSRLRSPPLDQPLSSGSFMVVERSLSKGSSCQTSSTDHHRYPKILSKTSALPLPSAASSSSSSALVIDRHDNAGPVSLFGGESTESYHNPQHHHQSPLVDLSHPITATEISLHKSSSAPLPNTAPALTSINNNNNINTSKEPLPHSISVFMKNSSLASTQQQQTSQEFYTINDEDDLEINWPKETVNA